MENNSNHNGKDVNRDRTPRNGQNSGGTPLVNKVKKNNTAGEKEVKPGESKKIPLNTNRNQGGQRKSGPKGQVIKLSDKGSKIHPVETAPVRESRPAYRAPSPTGKVNTSVTETPVVNKESNDTNSRVSEKSSFMISDKTGQWLLIAAVLFLIAWVVLFFYYHIGGNSHMLLAFAVICAVISLAGKRKK
ncbi:MAG: hypothetical protein ACM3PR_15360 [Bacteroidales bacterium]